MPAEKLTPKQEIFVLGLLEGKSQVKAYLAAYPKANNWTDGAVAVNASKLAKNANVLLRYMELLDESKNEALWSREKSVEALLYLLNTAKKEIEMRLKSFEDEAAAIKSDIEKESDSVKKYELKQGLYALYRQDWIPATAARIKRGAIESLNRLHGFYNPEFFIQRNVSINFNNFSVDELRSILKEEK